MPRSALSLIRLLPASDSAPADMQLLRAFESTRSDGAFEELVRRHGPMVLAACRRVLGNPDDAEDAFQAVFLVLARKASTVRGNLAGWLYAVAVRTARGGANHARPAAEARDPGQRPAFAGVSPGNRPQTRRGDRRRTRPFTGKDLERQILEKIAGTPLRVIGPNCLGVMNPLSGLNATFAQTMARPGNVAFISQSGALCTAVLDWSQREMVGYSAFVSIGSMLDVDWGDLIDYLGNDPRTRRLRPRPHARTRAGSSGRAGSEPGEATRRPRLRLARSCRQETPRPRDEGDPRLACRHSRPEPGGSAAVARHTGRRPSRRSGSDPRWRKSSRRCAKEARRAGLRRMRPRRRATTRRAGRRNPARGRFRPLHPRGDGPGGELPRRQQVRPAPGCGLWDAFQLQQGNFG